VTVAEVRLWGSKIGAVSIDADSAAAVFQYDPEFAAHGIELAPLVMPLRSEPYSFPQLRAVSFHSLPGLLADSLPDRYGTAVIDAWLAAQGRSPESFDVVERLCYIGSRGMGALEFAPAARRPSTSANIDIDALVALASEVLTNREALVASLDPDDASDAMRDILSVGTSAGGARAKAVIAYNERTGEVRSGQAKAPDGFEHWLLKFDGVADDRESELDGPRGYGRIEFAYSLMAAAAGVRMTACRLLQEGGRSHFMTRRFDRAVSNRKLHLQSLAAIAHYDFNQAGAYSYEQALMMIRRLGLGIDAVEQQFRRMVFNVVARNQDDHVKNIAFLMNRRGAWALSPAFDVTYSYAPGGVWTSQHQMTINGKRDGFTVADLRAVSEAASMKRGRAERILEEVQAAVSDWPRFAAPAGVDDDQTRKIAAARRLTLPDS
jgi:serine/threonine-protein kinase HipA